MIETEVRSFISKEKYRELLEKLERRAEKIKEDKQITYYFSGGHDLRIQKNKDFAKLWLKGGEIHDKHREELEVRFNKEDFEELGKLLKLLGYEIEIKWYRRRHKFRRDGLEICIDHTLGYGRIIEIERKNEEGKKEGAYEELEKVLEELGVKKTPRKEFDKRYQKYKKSWQEILKDQDLNPFSF